MRALCKFLWTWLENDSNEIRSQLSTVWTPCEITGDLLKRATSILSDFCDSGGTVINKMVSEARTSET